MSLPVDDRWKKWERFADLKVHEVFPGQDFRGGRFGWWWFKSRARHAALYGPFVCNGARCSKRDGHYYVQFAWVVGD